MLLGALQENLLVLLAFDATHAPIIRGAVAIELFGGPNRAIAAACYDYLDRYKQPPGDHLPDLLDDKLNGDSMKEAQLFGDILGSMHQLKATINTQFVMNQLDKFINRQTLRSMAVELAKNLTRDTEESLEEAQRLIGEARQQSLKLFDPGLRLSDEKHALEFLSTQVRAFPTGMPELDKRGFGPVRGEMLLFIANAKRGKSWFCIHLAKMAILQRLRVVHISLEMSRRRCAMRYMQALFGLAKRSDQLTVAKLELDSLQRITDYTLKHIYPKLSLTDPDIEKKLLGIIKQGKRLLDNVVIKDFPTGQLSVPQLKAYLDNLEAMERFTPDLVLLDYPDLMKLDKSNYRLDIDRTYVELRGLAAERNVALVVVSQAHRAAHKAKYVGGENVAEAYSKLAHADTAITYSQSAREQPIGLARLKVVGGRNDEEISVVISQNYAIGGFALNSYLQKGPYFKILPPVEETADDETT
jgi:hypothetical protein